VTEVVPDSELMPTARSWAEALADGPPVAIRMTKRMMYKQQTMDLENALRRGACDMVTNYCEDVKEGLLRFTKNVSRVQRTLISFLFFAAWRT
jgi:enoyl-CoA hydratase/carnithine racemase